MKCADYFISISTTVTDLQLAKDQLDIVKVNGPVIHKKKTFHSNKK
jgi:hypothetical protein